MHARFITLVVYRVMCLQCRLIYNRREAFAHLLEGDDEAERREEVGPAQARREDALGLPAPQLPPRHRHLQKVRVGRGCATKEGKGK